MQTLSLQSSTSKIDTKDSSSLNSLVAGREVSQAEFTPFQKALNKQIGLQSAQDASPAAKPPSVSDAANQPQQVDGQAADTSAQPVVKDSKNAQVSGVPIGKKQPPRALIRHNNVQQSSIPHGQLISQLHAQRSGKGGDKLALDGNAIKVAGEEKQKNQPHDELVKATGSRDAVNENVDLSLLVGLQQVNAVALNQPVDAAGEQNGMKADVVTPPSSQKLDALLGNALVQTNKMADHHPKSVESVGADQADFVDHVLSSIAVKDGGDQAGEHPKEMVIVSKGVEASSQRQVGAVMDGAKSAPLAGADGFVANHLAPAQPLVVAATQGPILAQQLGSSNTVNVYPGKAGWDQAIGQKVVWMVGAEVQSASLTLNPPDLGPLQVVISVNNDQVDTTFISDNEIVRQALEDGLSNLREKMSESGIQLGQANVNSSNQSQQGFQQTARGASSATGVAKSSSDGLPDSASDQASVSIRSSNGLVDTFA